MWVTGGELGWLSIKYLLNTGEHVSANDWCVIYFGDHLLFGILNFIYLSLTKFSFTFYFIFLMIYNYLVSYVADTYLTMFLKPLKIMSNFRSFSYTFLESLQK
jgi:hypothetical protein